jgi:hypothetical protein
MYMLYYTPSNTRALLQVFQPYHGDLVISDKTELTESAIMSSVSNLRARNKA